MAAYGAMNAAQDFWNEQLQKRDWVDWSFPKAIEPTLTPIWLVILAASAAIFVLLRKEAHHRDVGASAAPTPP